MNVKRIVNIDALKGLSIISVILLHSLDASILSVSRSAIHIGQAVPVFVLITFYLSFLSLDKNGRTIKESYNSSRVKKMIKRILCPFAIVTVVQCVLLLCVSRLKPLDLLIGGGYGPGSYYVWIYLQIWFLVPCFYKMLKKDQVKGSIIIFILSIGLNVVCSYICPDELWRLLAIRYLPLSVFGWIWLNERKINLRHKTILIFMGVMSLMYLLIWAKNDYSPFIYFGGWNSQNYPVYFWTLILVVLLMKIITVLPEKVHVCLSWLGNNSWYIFLAQMFFISCVSLKRFPTILNEFITQIIYVCFVFVVSMGSVLLINLTKKTI